MSVSKKIFKSIDIARRELKKENTEGLSRQVSRIKGLLAYHKMISDKKNLDARRSLEVVWSDIK